MTNLTHDIVVREDFLPEIAPREVCLMFQKARTHGVIDPVVGIIKGQPDQHRCGIAYLSVFHGLFDEVGFNQKLIDNATYADMSDELMLEKVFEKIVELGGPIRLAIKKYVDEEGNHRYAKYVDFDANRVLRHGEEELRRIIYFLIHACDTDGMLVPKIDRSWMNRRTQCLQQQKPTEQET